MTPDDIDERIDWGDRAVRERGEPIDAIEVAHHVRAHIMACTGESLATSARMVRDGNAWDVDAGVFGTIRIDYCDPSVEEIVEEVESALYGGTASNGE